MSKFRSRTFWLTLVASAALSAEAANATSMWSSISDQNTLRFEHYTSGPSAPSTAAYILNLGGPVSPDRFYGFQFLDDGSMWAAISDQNTLRFEHYTSGPSAPSTAAYILNLGGPVSPDRFYGFQFLDDGSMWAAISDQNTLRFEHYTSGPSAPSTAAYILNLGGPVSPDRFYGFQFLDDGSMWAAISDQNTLRFEHYTSGPSAPSTAAYILNLGGPVSPDRFYGFQFLDDGSMWAAISDQNTLRFEHYTSGPSAPSTAAYTLNLGGPVSPDRFYGFQFLDAPVPGAVPEPATWAMMIVGFGMAGAALRNRRRMLSA